MISEKTNRKFIETFDVNDWEIETDTGWEDITTIGKTIEYEKWILETERKKIECADTHIVFDNNFNEVYVKDLHSGDLIITKNGIDKVLNVYNSKEFENMYDLEVNSKNHRYYTNDILSHNSIWLANLAANAVRLGYNSALISLEMRDKHVVKRLGANMLGISMSEYSKLAEDQDMIRKKLSNIGFEDLKQPGKLWIKEYPTSAASVKDVERWLLKMEQIKGIKFKTVFIDYINILMNWRNPNSENTYLKIKQIAEDLRAMSTRNNWAIITLTQLNRCLTLDTLVETKKGKLRIDKLLEGDEILTPEGFAPVTKIYPIKKQRVYKIITKSGKEIKVSDKHLTPMSNGKFCTVHELKSGDKILSKSNKIEKENKFLLNEEYIDKIIKCNEEETIDISVGNNTRLFFANDIVTHNSGFAASGSLSLTNIAESSGLGHTVDWMGGLIQDELMYANNEYLIQTMLNRNEGYKNSRKKFNIDYSYMRLTEDSNSQIILDTING